MSGMCIKKSQGVGLIEVLVTLLLLSVALLTLTTLQSRSLQYNQGAYFRSQANIYAGDILDRMRNNSTVLTSYNIAAAAYNLSGSPATGSLATKDVDQWRRIIASNLPDGRGSINCVAATRVCTIAISWVGQSTEDSTTFSYVARL